MKTTITLETKLKKNDFLVRSSGDSRKVIEVLGELCFLSSYTDTQEYGLTCTLEEIVNEDYELLTPDWSPDELKEGDEYWYIVDDCMYGVQVQKNTYSLRLPISFKGFPFYKNLGLVFPTKEAAEAKLKEIMSK